MQPDFSLPSKECKYVVNAWRAPQQLMLALGAGAHTHYFGGHNWTNVYPVAEYIKTVKEGLVPIAVGAKVTERELMSKYMVLGVRALNVSKSKFRELFGIDMQDAFREQLSYLIRLGWAADKGDEYQLTRDGIYYVDNICKLFYSEENRNERQPRGKKLYNFVPKKFYGKDSKQ